MKILPQLLKVQTITPMVDKGTWPKVECSKTSCNIDLQPATSLWWPPPPQVTLGIDEVHVWRANLDQPTSHLQRFREILAPDELDRVERYYFPVDQHRFIAARGSLRSILSNYMNLEPSQIHFRYNPHGKPELVSDSSETCLRFNLAHSNGVALYAVARGQRVGVDIEYIRADVSLDQIARHCFSTQEYSTFCELPAFFQLEAFYRCWTRKEAYIKAIGQGITFPLRMFDVSLMPSEPALLLGNQVDPQEVFRWSLRELTPAPGYAAAVAVEGHSWKISCWQLQVS